MSMIPAARAAEMFEQIIGWPYSSPGSNDQRGIDCSGAWVRVYAAFGESVYHGSNTIFRKYCPKTGAIRSASDLRVGMAVLKRRFDGKEPAQYSSDGIGNLYHIGCVTSVSPLRIVHATTPVARVDTTLGNWTHWGTMDKVAYGATITSPASPIPPSTGSNETAEYKATVTTNKDPLNLRSAPNQNAGILSAIPRGATVEVLEDPDAWVRVRYQGVTGYASSRYLTPIQ